MPLRRKRAATKNAKERKRGKPKLPEGDFNTSMTAEEQESKLKNYIVDYQLQVEGKLERMRKYIQTMKGLIANCYRYTMVGLIKSVKEMTMEEFMSKGGNVDVLINAQVHATLNDLVNYPTPVLGVPTNGRLPFANASNNVDIAGLCLDQSSLMSQITSNVQTAGKSTRKRKAKPENKPPAPPNATRSSRRLQAKSSTIQNEVTPMSNMNTLSILNHAMFVTPKFDPRLPIPDSARQPKAGESVMSLHGSPLNYATRPAGVSVPRVIIPLTGGKTMQLSVDEQLSMNDEEVDVANDSVAQQNIRLLQEKLSKLLKMPKNVE